MLHKELFYFACRHHVLAIIIIAVWKEVQRQAEIILISKTKKLWDNLDDKSSFKTLNIANRQLKQQKYVVVKFLVKNCLHQVKQRLIVCLATTIENELS